MMVLNTCPLCGHSEEQSEPRRHPGQLCRPCAAYRRTRRQIRPKLFTMVADVTQLVGALEQAGQRIQTSAPLRGHFVTLQKEITALITRLAVLSEHLMTEQAIDEADRPAHQTQTRVGSAPRDRMLAATRSA